MFQVIMKDTDIEDGLIHDVFSVKEYDDGSLGFLTYRNGNWIWLDANMYEPYTRVTSFMRNRAEIMTAINKIIESGEANG